MARAHYWQYLLNTEGQPIPNADIIVYNAGTDVKAYVFDSETGGIADDHTGTIINGIIPSSPHSLPPHTKTDANGFFEFWIGDHTEINGYQAGLKFKIAWSKTGSISPGEIDNVDISIDTNQAGVFTRSVSPEEWTGSGPYYVNIEHNLNKPYPMAICYDETRTSVAITITHVAPFTNTTVFNNTIDIGVVSEPTDTHYITIVG